jgi:hypothetical protein
VFQGGFTSASAVTANTMAMAKQGGNNRRGVFMCVRYRSLADLRPLFYAVKPSFRGKQ